jgi:purine-binding chemotaxis protein CheW
VTPDEAGVERILRQRAHDLAREQTQSSEQRGEALVVRVGNARYAVPLVGLGAVMGLESLTPLPGAPDVVAGLTQIQGHVVTIVHLGALLGEAPEPPAAALLIEVDSGSFGLGVSGYENVIPIPAKRLESVPPGLSEAASRYVEGVVASQGIGVLRLATLVNDLMQLETGEEEP